MRALRWRKIVACILAYNEENTIGAVIRGALRHVDMVIVCDDGSTDRTGQIAREAGALVIRHERNMGYGTALRTLFDRARAIDPDVMVILDGDGQHDPDDIPSLVKPVLSGEADIVMGSRFLGKTKMPIYRGIGIRLISFVVRLTAYPGLRDAQSGFRAYSRRAVRLMRITELGMGASTEILLKAAYYGLRLKEVPVEVGYKGVMHKISPWRHGLSILLVTVKHAVRKYLNLFPSTLKAGNVKISSVRATSLA